MEATHLSLSVVIPTYNMAGFLAETILKLMESVDKSCWHLNEIVIVNDGSTDDTIEELDKIRDQLHLHGVLMIISQENSGRFVSRKIGLANATGDYVLLIDSRVSIGLGALQFVYSELLSEPKAFTGHIEVNPSSKSIGYFWSSIEKLAWSAYWNSPRACKIDNYNFERYPIGTTCFIAPKEWLLDATNAFNSKFSDLKYANDDTAVLSYIVNKQGVHINPSWNAWYKPRQSFLAFLLHANHRGKVFIDAHAKAGGRYFLPLLLFCAGSVSFAILVVTNPVVAISLALLMQILATGYVLYRGLDRNHALAILIYSVPFTFFYGAGIFSGMSKRFNLSSKKAKSA
jgi:glycosyltransferase involved in cell wall biosynthesis